MNDFKKQTVIIVVVMWPRYWFDFVLFSYQNSFCCEIQTNAFFCIRAMRVQLEKKLQDAADGRDIEPRLISMHNTNIGTRLSDPRNLPEGASEHIAPNSFHSDAYRSRTFSADKTSRASDSCRTSERSRSAQRYVYDLLAMVCTSQCTIVIQIPSSRGCVPRPSAASVSRVLLFVFSFCLTLRKQLYAVVMV